MELEELQNLNPALIPIQTSVAQDTTQYIARKVFPEIRSDAFAGKYPIWDESDFTRLVAAKRALATESVGSSEGPPTTGNFFCEKYSVHRDVPWEFRSMTSIANLHANAIKWCQRQINLALDIDWVNTFFHTGVWGTDVTLDDLWDEVGATPIQDLLELRHDAKLKNGGHPFNTIIFGSNAWTKMQSTADFLGRINGGATPDNPAIMNLELFKRMTGFANAWEIETIYSTTKEGQAVTNTWLAANSILITYVPPAGAVDIMEPSGGFTIDWVIDGVTGPNGEVAKSFPMNELDADRVEATQYMDQVVVAPTLGVFINAAVTDMAFIALRKIRRGQGRDDLMPGDLVPEAAKWPNAGLWIRSGHLAQVADGKEQAFMEALMAGDAKAAAAISVGSGLHQLQPLAVAFHRANPTVQAERQKRFRLDRSDEPGAAHHKGKGGKGGGKAKDRHPGKEALADEAGVSTERIASEDRVQAVAAADLQLTATDGGPVAAAPDRNPEGGPTEVEPEPPTAPATTEGQAEAPPAPPVQAATDLQAGAAVAEVAAPLVPPKPIAAPPAKPRTRR